MSITRKELHQVEMELVNYCDDIDIDRKAMKEIIINKFTDLMQKVKA